MNDENQKYEALIDSYFENTLSAEERESFLNELDVNAKLKKEFSLHLEVQEAISDAQYDHVKAVIGDVVNPARNIQERSKKSSWIFQALKYAAVISAIIIFTLLASRYFSSEDSASKLANNYFEPYPTYNTFRGEGNLENIEELAFINYDSKKYKEAEINFEKLIESDPTNMAYVFYKANALIARGDYENAIPLLKRVVESKNDLFIDQAKWYLSLSYLGNNNIEDAKSLLESIKQNENSKYYSKASEILEKLDVS